MTNFLTDLIKPKWTSLERVPYLWALLHEGLRLTPGIAHRSARKAPDEELVYNKGSSHYIIPKGTPIGMSSMIQNWDSTLFPDPDAFKPERWLLSTGQQNYALEKKLLSFGHGSRICLGMDLAYCEMYLMIAELVLRLLLRSRLVNTTADDVEYDHDCIVPSPKKGSMAVRIVID